MAFRDSVYTIREINQIAKDEGLSKIFQSYTTLYNLARSGRVAVTKLGNRYLMRVCDIEKYLTGDTAQTAGGIRRIN